MRLKAILIAALVVLAAILASIALIALTSCSVVLRSCTRIENNAVEAVDKLTNADKVIGDYQWFQDTYMELKAIASNIKLAKSQLDMYTDKDARERRVIEINGMQAVLQSRIGEYNSRSKQITRNLWKDPNLPYQISQEDL